MLSLKEYRSKAKGLADFLNWAFVIADGVIANKDGSFMASWYFRGEDTASSTHAELAVISHQLNAALTKLGSGWCIHVDAIRIPSVTYPAPAESYFPDRVSQAIDEERRKQYQSEGSHYETQFVLTLTWCPPSAAFGKAESMMYNAGSNSSSQADRNLAHFERTCHEFAASLSNARLSTQRLKGVPFEDAQCRTQVHDLQLSFLHYALTGDNHPILLPPIPMYIDAILGTTLVGGIAPKVGGKRLRCVSIDGFPQASYPSILDRLGSLPIAYRFNTRFIMLDTTDGKAIIDKHRKKWKQKIVPLMSQLFNTGSGVINQDAAVLAADAEAAMSEAESGNFKFGYYTATIVLLEENEDVLNDAAQKVKKTLQELGFSARIEDLNTVEAWLGSLPSHTQENVRRPLMNSMNVADLIPSTAVWAGLDKNPCDLRGYDRSAPPLLYCTTTGGTPFRMSLHADDVGHTLICGPTGSGKSVLLGTLVAQHLRYKDARVFLFDKGYSSFVLTKAVGGLHYDIAGEHQTLQFCPLANIDNSNERLWANEWLETLAALQSENSKIPVTHRQAIGKALDSLSKLPSNARSLTDFYGLLQEPQANNPTLRPAIEQFTGTGPMGDLLDGQSDALSGEDGNFFCFELDHLMDKGEKLVMAVLTYLFHRIEQMLDGRPTLIVIDEAWVVLSHPLFQAQIKTWLLVLRKANCAVVFATQSLSHIVESPISSVLIENCPTKILLPNDQAAGEISMAAYKKLELNSRQIQILAHAIRKRQYYYMSPNGRRLFELELGPIARAFVTKSSKTDVAKARELIAAYGAGWLEEWAKYCSV